MSSTDVACQIEGDARTPTDFDMKLEVVTLPVSDVDRAKSFYESLGWRLDADFDLGESVRAVQFTPPHSECSIGSEGHHQGRAGLRRAPGPGRLRHRGGARGPHQPRRRGQRVLPPRPDRVRAAAWTRSAAHTTATPHSAIRTATAGCSRRSRRGCRAGCGRTDMDVAARQICCMRPPSITARSRRPPHRTTGGTGTRRTWTPARSGSIPDEAAAAAGRYMAEVKHVVVRRGRA